MKKALDQVKEQLPASIKEISTWARIAKEAGILPRDVNVYQAMAIIQAGREMGLQPLQSLRMMSFIKGRLVMHVQLQLALARKKCGVELKEIEDGDDYCKVTLKRGNETVTTMFTVEDAKKAGLINPDPQKYKDSNWGKYQRQMLRWRAIGDALRLIAPDVVFGLLSPEEAETLPPIDEEIQDVQNIEPVEETPEQETVEPTQAQKKKLYAMLKSYDMTKEEIKKFYEFIMTDAGNKKQRISQVIDNLGSWLDIYSYLKEQKFALEIMQDFFKWATNRRYDNEVIKSLASSMEVQVQEYLKAVDGD